MATSLASVNWDAYQYEDEDYNAVDEVLTEMPWFVSHASRAVAEQLLTLAVPQSFLVRPSSQAGSYALSMTDEHGSLIHAAIQQNAQHHYYISGAPDPYPTISQLVGSLKLTPVPRKTIQSQREPQHQVQAPSRAAPAVSASPRRPPQSRGITRGGSMRDVLAVSAKTGKNYYQGILQCNGQRFYFVLQDDRLEWFEVNAASNPDAVALGRLPLAPMAGVKRTTQTGLAILDQDARPVLELKAQSANEAAAWLAMLKKCMPQCAADTATPASPQRTTASSSGAAPPRSPAPLSQSGDMARTEAPSMSGPLRLSGKGKQQVHGVLRDGFLLWFQSPAASDPLGAVPLSGAQVQRVDDADGTLRLAPSVGHAFELSTSDLHGWHAALSDAVTHCAAARPRLTSQPVVRSAWVKLKGKRKFCMLAEDVLLWADSETGVPVGNATLDGAGVFLLNQLTSLDAGGKKVKAGSVGRHECAFVLVTAFGRFFTFEGRSASDAQQWVAALRENVALASQTTPPNPHAATTLAGWMEKKGKRRHFVLRGEVLLWSDSESGSASGNLKNSADLRGAAVRIGGRCELSLYTAHGAEYVLRAHDDNNRDAWYAALHAAIQRSKAANVRRLRTAARGGGLAVSGEYDGWVLYKNKRRWMTLRGGTLLWYDAAPDEGKKSNLKGSMTLDKCKPEKDRDRQGVFRVVADDGSTTTFQVETSNDVDAWVGALKLAIQSTSHEHAASLGLARRHADELAGLFGLAPGGADVRSGEFDTQLDMLHAVLAADDSAETVRATLLLACAHGRHLNLLVDCVSRELDKSISVGTLFRTNSITTKCVREFLLISTYEFLHASLAGPVRSIINDPNGYECDPNKMGGGSNADALRRVTEAANGMLTSIESNLHLLPHDVRLFFYHTKESVNSYFPGHYRVVAAGFLFLRFLCPAVISPVMFGLVKEKLEPAAQRALLLVTKVLQNLANGVEFGKKEQYMQDMNPWLRSKLPVVDNLLEQLTHTHDGAGVVFRPGEEAGDPATHISVLLRRTVPKLDTLRKKAEADAQPSMNTIGGFIRLSEICENQL